MSLTFGDRAPLLYFVIPKFLDVVAAFLILYNTVVTVFEWIQFFEPLDVTTCLSNGGLQRRLKVTFE